VDFILQVPVEAEVSLRAGVGSLALSGTRGAAILRSAFGEVHVENVEGPLAYTGASATISLEQIDAAEGDITVENRFGSLTALGLAGKTLSFTTSNGDLVLINLEASGSVLAENQFGETRIENLRASSLNATNTSGAVQIQNSLLSGALEVEARFTPVSLEGVEAAQYTVETSNALLELEGAHGKLTLTNSFGEIRVSQARAASLELKNTNGEIDFSGSLDEGAAHRVDTTFGDITLRLPPESALTLDLATGIGMVESDLALTGAREDNA
jgi:DUF4097 and DUF4098 domain-containing protein YvlB